jgi:hypothetical protein
MLDPRLEPPSQEFRMLNPLARVCLLMAALAIWPYLAMPILTLISYVTNTVFMSGIVSIFALLGGAPFGLISLVTGIIALLQMRKRRPTERGLWMAFVGMIVGPLAIAANVYVWWFISTGSF